MLQVELGRFDYGRIKAKRQSANWLVALSAIETAAISMTRATVSRKPDQTQGREHALNVTTTLSSSTSTRKPLGLSVATTFTKMMPSAALTPIQRLIGTSNRHCFIHRSRQ